MRKWVLLLAFVAMLWPASAAAQAPGNVDEEGALIRINADVTIAAGETIDNLVVINGDAVIDGAVTGSLLVIDGDATINGTVADDITVIAGDVFLREGSTVNDVHAIRGDIEQTEGATVTGDTEEGDLTGLWAVLGVLSVLLWIGITIAAIVAGVLFALVGGRQLTSAAMLMTDRPVNAIVGAVFLAIALPVIAVLVMLTVVGLPLGLGILLFLAPALAFLGYLVAATRLGMALTKAVSRESDRPVLAVVVGVLVLQVIAIIPFAGGVVALLASLWGAGALAAFAFEGMRGRPRSGDTSVPSTL